MVGDYPEWQALVITVVGGVVGVRSGVHPTLSATLAQGRAPLLAEEPAEAHVV